MLEFITADRHFLIDMSKRATDASIPYLLPILTVGSSYSMPSSQVYCILCQIYGNYFHFYGNLLQCEKISIKDYTPSALDSILYYVHAKKQATELDWIEFSREKKTEEDKDAINLNWKEYTKMGRGNVHFKIDKDQQKMVT